MGKRSGEDHPLLEVYFQVPVIAAACGLCRKDSEVSIDIRYEEKYPINDSFVFHPNIDAVIHNKPGSKNKRFAIECKFSEAYGAHKHGRLKEKYIECDGIWDDIPALRAFSERISPDDSEFSSPALAGLIGNETLNHHLDAHRHCEKNEHRTSNIEY